MDIIKHAAVITFPDHMSQEECNVILARMVKAGYCEKAYDGKPPTVRPFCPDRDCPTLYFP